MRITILFILFNALTFAQNIISRPPVLVSTDYLNTFVQGTTEQDSIPLTWSGKPFVIDSTVFSTNISFPTNTSILADSNKGVDTTTIGDWTYSAGDTLYNNADSTYKAIANNGSTSEFSLPLDTLSRSNYYEFYVTHSETGGTNYVFEDSSECSIVQSAWTIGNGIASYDASINSYFIIPYTFTNGEYYKILADVDNFASDYRYDVYNSSEYIRSATTTSDTLIDINYVCSSNGTYFRFRGLAGYSSFAITNLRIYHLDFESQSVESAKLIYSFNGSVIDSSETISYSTQIDTIGFWGTGDSSSFSFTLSDTGKVNFAIEGFQKQGKYNLRYLDTLQLPIVLDVSTVGTFAESAIVYGNFPSSPDTIDVDYTVVPSSNILTAPYDLVASNSAGTGIAIVWSDSNVADTIFTTQDDFDEDSYAGWLTNWSGALSIPDEDLRITDNSYAGGWIWAYRDYTLNNTDWCRLKVEAIVGTANLIGIVVKDLGTGTYIINDYARTIDTSFDTVFTPFTTSIRVYLQVQTDDGEYGEFDNYTFEQTEESYDYAELYVQEWLGGVPNSDFSLLTTTTDTFYTHTGLSDGAERGYKVRFKDGASYSSYSNTDTETYTETASTELTPTYFVSSSTGNDSNDGLTESTPWQSLTKLNTEISGMVKGSVIGLKRDDSFTGTVTLDNRISITAYGSGAKPVIQTTSTDYIFDLTNVDSVRINNIKMLGKKWVQFYNSDRDTVEYCEATHIDTNSSTYTSDRPLYMYSSDYNIVRHNDFRGTPSESYQDLFFITGNTQYNLIEYNVFRNSTHSLLYFKGTASDSSLVSYSGDSYPHHNVIRHNYFFSIYHTAIIQLGGTYANLLEYNYFERTGMGESYGTETGYNAKYDGNNRGLAMYVFGEKYIIRNNIIRKGGTPISDIETVCIDMGSRQNADHVADRSDSNRVYNNTAYDNYGIPFALGVSNSTDFESYLGADGNIYKNNFAYKSGEDSVDFKITRSFSSGSYNPDTTYIVFDYNAMMSSVVADNLAFGGSFVGDWRISDLPADGYLLEGSDNNNIENDGTFIYSPTITENYNDTDWDEISAMYMIDGTSDLRNAGGPLTYVNGNVSSSTTVPVFDTKYFVDGSNFGDMVESDSVYFKDGSTLYKRKISNISGSNLVLTEAVSLNDSSFVSLPYKGNSKDIGAVEYDE